MQTSHTFRRTLVGFGIAACVASGPAIFAAPPMMLAQATDSSASVGAAVTDTAITTKVKAKFSADSRLKGSDIDVETNNGVVTLTGSAASASAKNAAEELAKNVSDVKSINNQITAPSVTAGLGAKTKHAAHETGAAISDTFITTKIKTQFGTDKKTKGSNVDVSTTNGIAALSGTVVSDAQKKHVISIAKHTKGVKQVDTTALSVVTP